MASLSAFNATMASFQIRATNITLEFVGKTFKRINSSQPIAFNSHTLGYSPKLNLYYQKERKHPRYLILYL